MRQLRRILRPRFPQPDPLDLYSCEVCRKDHLEKERRTDGFCGRRHPETVSHPSPKYWPTPDGLYCPQCDDLIGWPGTA